MGQWTLLRVAILGWWLLQLLFIMTVLYVSLEILNTMIETGKIINPFDIFKNLIPGLSE